MVEEPTEADSRRETDPRLSEILGRLPLLGDDLYLRMQALNLEVVDQYLRNYEGELLREYIDTERTPVPLAVLVSALSQLWIFGVYELLRTWRQRVSEVLLFTSKISQLKGPLRTAAMYAKRADLRSSWPYGSDYKDDRWPRFKKAVSSNRFRGALQLALDRVERLFRRLESLRVHLAKHEVPKSKGIPTMGAGYGRINMETGSIYYQVQLRTREIDMISRREISDEAATFPDVGASKFLPMHVRPQAASIPESSYGMRRARVTLKDGTSYKVMIQWDRLIVSVEGRRKSLPARSVVKVEPV